MLSDDEANIPAQYAPPEAQAWLPCSDENSSRPDHPEKPAGQGPHPAVRLRPASGTLRSPRSLSTKGDFAKVFAEGRRARADGLTVWALPRKECETRLGLAVGTGAGGAAVRNRIRRRLRALVRSARPEGVDLVIGADSAATSLSYQQLEDHLKQALARALPGEL